MKKIIGFLVCFAFLLVGVVYADPYEARPHEWRDKNEFRKKVQIKSGSELEIESGGELEIKSGSTLTMPAGTITAANIANVTRELFFPMAGWAVDGGDDLDEATAPDIGDDDNIPSITWDNSGETGAIQQTFRLPSTYVSGLTLYCLVSSDTDVGTAGILDWQIWVNNDGVAFDAGAIAQTGAAMGTASDPNVSNEVLTLTLDATGEAAISAGSWITIDLFNATTHASANLELKGVHGTYTATQ